MARGCLPMPSAPDSNPDRDVIPFPQETPCPAVLVTGASGFLGSEIVRQFAASGASVRALARQWSAGELVPRNVVRCTGDITQPATLWPALDGVKTIVHSAGLAHQFGKKAARPGLFHQVNAQGTEAVMRAAVAANVEHVVLVSSVSVYGGGSQPTDESCPCRASDPYGSSKLQAEQIAVQIAEATGMRLTVLRMATIFGEGDPGNIRRLMQTIDQGRFIWLGTGSNRKSLIYRGDAARACQVAATTKPRVEAGREPVQVYNISLPPVPVSRIVGALSTGLGRPTPHWYIPAPLVRTMGGGLSLCMAGRGPAARIHRTITKWLSDDIYPGERFERDFGFQPQVSLEEGLRRETAWFRHSKAA